ncbi:hypothetical protein B0H66DRAFT_613721 [Apodospora peruviana]|uniref:Uncharacterized protein n=1 Tax=Apodospora peruviana TaxID=516989 RepID=A0AAE0IU89_9PEZI|nr:hypothetical protein B0H66DRAFT_613721 [Apodospora peruviana]
MQLTKNLVGLAAIISLATAAPWAAREDMQVDMEAREVAGTVSVTAYAGDTCSGGDESVVVTDGGFRCFAVSNKRSIGMRGREVIPSTIFPSLSVICINMVPFYQRLQCHNLERRQLPGLGLHRGHGLPQCLVRLCLDLVLVFTRDFSRLGLPSDI